MDWEIKIKAMVKRLKKYKKVYGTFSPRTINGARAEFSFMIMDGNGQHWHFFTTDFRRYEPLAIIRKTSGPKDFKGEQNLILHSPHYQAQISFEKIGL